MGPVFTLTRIKICRCPSGTTCNCEERIRNAPPLKTPKHPKFPHPPRNLPRK